MVSENRPWWQGILDGGYQAQRLGLPLETDKVAP
jgi:hypothetical protein